MNIPEEIIRMKRFGAVEILLIGIMLQKKKKIKLHEVEKLLRIDRKKLRRSILRINHEFAKIQTTREMMNSKGQIAHPPLRGVCAIVLESFDFDFGFKNEKNKKELPAKTPEKTSIEDEYILEVISFWNKKGSPFAKTRRSKQLEMAKKIIRKLFKKHRSKIFEIIDRGHLHMSNPGFVYRPKSNIPIRQFFKITAEDRKYNPSLSGVKYSSWFQIFNELSEREIYEEFYRHGKIQNKDLNNSVVNIFSEITLKAEKSFSANDRKNFQKCCMMVVEFAKENDVTENTVLECMRRSLEDMKGRTRISSNTIVADFFWSEVMPEKMIETGITKRGSVPHAI